MTFSPPRCKICGQLHYGHEPHVFAKAPVAQRTEPPTSNRVAAGSTPAGCAKCRHCGDEFAPVGREKICPNCKGSRKEVPSGHVVRLRHETTVTKPDGHETKSRGGRPLIGDHPLTPAERKRMSRERKKADGVLSS